LTFPKGAHYFEGEMKRREKVMNPFLSRVEVKPVDEVTTVQNKGHGRWEPEMVVELNLVGPMWLCVIHDWNASNRVPRGGKFEPLDAEAFGLE